MAIAAAMARSEREIQQYYLAHQVDMTECEACSSMKCTRPRREC